MTATAAALVVQTALLIMLAFAVHNLLGRVSTLELISSSVPSLGGARRRGAVLTTDIRQRLGVGDATSAAIVFLSSGCTSCKHIAEQLVAPTDRLVLLAIEGNPPEIIGSLPPDSGVVLCPDAAHAFEFFSVRATPFSVAIDNGIVASARLIQTAREAVAA